MPSIAFFLYDCILARGILSKFTVADSKGVTPDVTADNSVISDSYWRHEQDITADLIRQMDRLCRIGG